LFHNLINHNIKNYMHEENTRDFAKEGLAFTKNGEPEKAIDCFRKAIEQKPDQPVWVFSNLGNQFLILDHLEEASSIFENLKVRHPDLPIGFLGLARIARKQNSLPQCIALWETCFRLFPGQAQAFWYFQHAEAHLEQGNAEKAWVIYENATKKYPDNVHGFIGMAKTAQHTGQWQKALDYWQICFDRFPSEIKPVWHKQKQKILLEMGQIANVQNEALLQLQTDRGKAYAEIISQKLENPAKHGLRFKYILIISYGRSGSTLLQGILNTIDGVLLRGENGNIFFDLFKTYQKLIDLKNSHKNAVLPNQPWYGMSFFDEDQILSQYQELAKGILLADQYSKASEMCVGFKEIRYDEIGDELELYLDFLGRLFPKAAFIFNTRNLKDVAKSAWWKEVDENTVVKKLSEIQARFEAYARGRDDCFGIRYEEVVAKGEKLVELYNFLGATYQPEIIDAVLAIPHSYSPEQQKIKKLFNEM